MNLIAEPNDLPTTSWLRGGAWKVELIVESSGAETHVLVPAPGSPQLYPYDPLQEAPNAYLAFAQLRDDLWAPDQKPSFSNLCESLVEFATEYGPPYSITGNAPNELAPRSGVEDILQEASLLAVAVRCSQALGGERKWVELQPAIENFLLSAEGGPFLMSYQAIRPWGYQESVELSYDLKTEEGLTQWLQWQMNRYPRALSGVYHTVRYHPINKWQPAYAYNSLLCAMWFQLSQMLLRHSKIRCCEGCQDLFEPTRSDQKYHNAYCRGATNARRTYQRKRG